MVMVMVKEGGHAVQIPSKINNGDLPKQLAELTTGRTRFQAQSQTVYAGKLRNASSSESEPLRFVSLKPSMRQHRHHLQLQLQLHKQQKLKAKPHRKPMGGLV
jgi:hypothetical protein